MAPVLLQNKPPPKLDPAQKELVVMETMKKEFIRGLFLLWLIIEVFLFLRVFLEGLGADPQAYFVSLVYVISGIFLLPFIGIFPRFEQAIRPDQPTFDVSALVAMFCYTVLVLLIIGVVFILTKMLKTEKQEEQIVEKNNPVDPTVSEKIVK